MRNRVGGKTGSYVVRGTYQNPYIETQNTCLGMDVEQFLGLVIIRFFRLEFA